MRGVLAALGIATVIVSVVVLLLFGGGEGPIPIRVLVGVAVGGTGAILVTASAVLTTLAWHKRRRGDGAIEPTRRQRTNELGAGGFVLVVAGALAVNILTPHGNLLIPVLALVFLGVLGAGYVAYDWL